MIPVAVAVAVAISIPHIWKIGYDAQDTKKMHL